MEIKQEVTIPNERRPDAVIWASKDWFICWELKIGASEGEDQTRDYIDADAFQSIGLEKEDVPADSHHYIYFAPQGDSPDADGFVPVSWEWIADQIQSFLVDSHGEYPARTTNQLETFVGTIRSELTMTNYQENQQEKAELYFEYYDVITEAQEAFENKWDWLSNNWGTELVDAIDEIESVDIPSLRNGDVAVEVIQSSIPEERWIFRQGESDWAGIFKEGWWRHRDDLSPIYTQADDKTNDVRITLYHRLEKHRESAVRNGSLKFELWQGTGHNDKF